MVRYAQLVLVIVLIGVWQLYSSLDHRAVFYVSSPLKVLDAFAQLTISGRLPYDASVTIVEAACGFVVGTILGSLTGILFWFFPFIRQVTKSFIVCFASVPVFAISPLVIIWFGTGIASKVILAGLAAYFIALLHSYEGLNQGDSRLTTVLITFGASKSATFRKAVVPSAIASVINGAKANIGLSLSGAFIGEVISSESGLGHFIMAAMGLFDMTRVIVGAGCFGAVAVAATQVLDRYGPRFAHWVVMRL